jgi:glutathione S-transferase
MYTLYVIPGSHACRSAMLMLEHKGLAYKRVDVVTLTHAAVVRMHGFDAGGQTRVAGSSRPLPLRMGDLFGTVPARAADGARVATNHGIARFLEQRVPDPPLFPADPVERARVEEVEHWANETLQMAARRILLAAARRDPAAVSRHGADGRMGYLLYRSELARRIIPPLIARLIFDTAASDDAGLMAELVPMLDRIDSLISEGVIGGSELNVADFMIAPSLALILYRPDAEPLLRGRPCLALVDRLLPEPGRPEPATVDA